MHPEYIQDQLEQSLMNLGIETIDVYYLHNPETQLGIISTDELMFRRADSKMCIKPD